MCFRLIGLFPAIDLKSALVFFFFLMSSPGICPAYHSAVKTAVVINTGAIKRVNYPPVLVCSRKINSVIDCVGSRGFVTAHRTAPSLSAKCGGDGDAAVRYLKLTFRYPN